MNSYQVVEHFISINGEGPLAGQLALFIRFKGCNLSCGYCDTRWANVPDAPYTEMTREDIYGLIKESGIRNITLTGGEPLLRQGMHELLELLGSDPGIHVEIETNGSIDLAPFTDIRRRPSFTMDYKTPASGMENKMHLPNFDILTSQDTVKFVVGSDADLEKSLEIIGQYHLDSRCHVYFSPVFGMIEPAHIVDFMIHNKLNNINLQIQMHKVIWDPEMRGV